MTEAPAPPPLPPSYTPELPRPLDALAAVARLRARFPSDPDAVACADHLYRYAMVHNDHLTKKANDGAR